MYLGPCSGAARTVPCDGAGFWDLNLNPPHDQHSLVELRDSMFGVAELETGTPIWGIPGSSYHAGCVR